MGFNNETTGPLTGTRCIYPGLSAFGLRCKCLEGSGDGWRVSISGTEAVLGELRCVLHQSLYDMRDEQRLGEFWRGGGQGDAAFCLRVRV